MLRKILAVTALAALAAFGAAQSKPLIINRVLINAAGGSDDGQGLEMFEIKNTSNASVSLTGVALVIIDNEGDRDGQLDGWYQFTGTIAANSTLCIQDLKTNGTQPSVSAPSGTSNGSSIGYEFFSGHTGTDLSNSGANYVLVDGFNSASATWEGFLDPDGNGILNSIPWTTSLDAFCVYPDGDAYPSGQANYISQLGMSAEHTIVAQVTASDDSTPDYFFRMYRVDGSGNKIYDRMLQSDVNALSSGAITLDTSELIWDDATAPTAADFKTSTGVAYGTSGSALPTLYVALAQGGNFTNWGSFDYILKNGFAYRH